MPPPLIQALQKPGCYDHPVESLHVVETHISWVLLTGPHAYKIKKPVNLGFLDFSTLAKRRRFCEEELRLNRRFSPELYLAVVPVTGSPRAPHMGGAGPALEYAVKMVQFPEAQRLDRVLARGDLTPRHVDDLAQALARFHREAEAAPARSPYGSPEQVMQPVEQNFDSILAHARGETRRRCQRLHRWARDRFAALRPWLAARKAHGFVRQCHGDAHLGNMVLLNDKIRLFDCIEFNPALRWIDVMNELAFLVMDLRDRGAGALARRCLDRYLQETGDYEGLAGFRFYAAYRALVRAKVTGIRLQQGGLGPAERTALEKEFGAYLELAEDYSHEAPPVLLITHGLSGSGKTTLTQELLERWDAVRVRSDVERKRLAGLPATARTGAGPGEGLYGPDMSRRTYDRLRDLARTVLDAGLPVIVDATFLRRQERDRFRALAQEKGVGFWLLDIRAPEAELRRRLGARQRQGRDASEATSAVLDFQLARREPLAPDEGARTLVLDSSRPPDWEGLLARLQEQGRGGAIPRGRPDRTGPAPDPHHI